MFSKESEIRPKTVLAELLNICREDALYAAEKFTFEEVACLACDSQSESDKKFIKNRFEYKICDLCGSIYNSKRMIPSSYNDFYKQSKSSAYFSDVFYPAVEAARKVKLYPERVKSILELYGKDSLKGKTLLDVGAGEGYFFDLLKESGIDATFRVIEPNPRLAEKCRSKGYDVFEGYVHQQKDWLGSNDYIFCFEVFEHVLNPSEFSESLKNLLAPRGRLLLTSLTASGLDLYALKDLSDMVAPPQHLNFFSLDGYKRFFEKIGFSKCEITTPGRLDVDILMNKLSDDPCLIENPLIRFVFDMREPARLEFQDFLRKAHLSSHIWVVLSN